MKKIIYIFQKLFQEAPISVSITITYYVFSAAVPAITTILYVNIFDSIINRNANSNENIWNGIIAFLGLKLLYYLWNYLYSALVNTGIFEKGSIYFRKSICEKVTKLSLIELEKADVLDEKKRAENAVEEDTLCSVFYQLLEVSSAAFSTMLIAIVLLKYHWILAVASISTVLPYLVIKVIRGRVHVKVRNMQVKTRRREQYYWKLLTEKTSVKELRVLDCEQYIADKWRKSKIQERTALLKEEKRDAEWLLFCDGIKVIGYFGSLFAAVVLVRYNLIELSMFGGMVMALYNMQSSMKSFLEATGEIPELLSLSENYFKFMLLPEEPIGKISYLYDKNECERDTGKWEINTKALYFSYPGSRKMILTNININIKSGEHVAIVGENGSGKTTLAKLLVGIFPVKSGIVEWNHYNVENVIREEWYRHVSIISQNFVKYYLTLRENVCLSDIENLRNNEHIEETLKEANFESSVGYDEILGTEFGGKDLSIGQWQKLAIARAIFRTFDFIVMDEPTSALDAITEKIILEEFLEAMEGKTAVLISHRMGICPKMDRIIVMKNGKIEEVGRHSELLAKQGEYARLYSLQAQWYE